MSEESKTQLKETESQTGKLSIPQALDVTVKCFAVFVGAVYICGFLTVNSHLGKYGIFNLGITDINYLLSGASFVFFIVAYALFGGRGIFLGKKWMIEDMELLTKGNPHPVGAPLAFIRSLVDVIFLLCLSAALFVGIAVDQNQTFWFYSVLSIIFLTSYTLDISNFDTKQPLVCIIVDGALKVAAIVAYFLLSSGSLPTQIFIIFLSFSAYINFVLDRFERYRTTMDWLLFSTVYSMVYFLVAAMLFGSVVYGNVIREIGGGQSMNVEIELSASVRGSNGEAKRSNISGEMIFASDSAVYLNTEHNVLILPWKNIVWLKSTDSENGRFRHVIDGILNILDVLPGISDEEIQQMRQRATGKSVDPVFGRPDCLHPFNIRHHGGQVGIAEPNDANMWRGRILAHHPFPVASTGGIARCAVEQFM